MSYFQYHVQNNTIYAFDGIEGTEAVKIMYIQIHIQILHRYEPFYKCVGICSSTFSAQALCVKKIYTLEV